MFALFRVEKKEEPMSQRRGPVTTRSLGEAAEAGDLHALPAARQGGRRFSRVLSVLMIAGFAACASNAAPEAATPPLVIFFVDGERLSQAEADALWGSTDLGRDADSVRVLKDSEALSRYGAEGRPGVVLIFLKGGREARFPAPGGEDGLRR
jgi:hypothetical protein